MRLGKSGHRSVYGESPGSIAGNQRGGSVVVLVMSLPLVLLLLCAALDFGRLVFLHMELENAAANICRDVEEGTMTTCGVDALSAVAFEVSPSLEADGLTLSIDFDFAESEEGSYRHRFYSRVDDGFVGRLSHTRERPFEVTLSLEGDCLTPIGGLMAPMFGGVDGFDLVVRSTGCMDETVEGGVW